MCSSRPNLRSKSQPARNILKALPKSLSLTRIPPLHVNDVIESIDVESLKITWKQLKDIIDDPNEELTAKIPKLSSTSTKIFVCNNINYKEKIDSKYILSADKV